MGYAGKEELPRNPRGIPIRRNGSLQPMCVRKMLKLMDDRYITKQAVDSKLGIKSYRVYNWETVRGMPDADQIAIIARAIGTTAEYLSDDSIPIMDNPPQYGTGTIKPTEQEVAAFRELTAGLEKHGLGLADLTAFLDSLTRYDLKFADLDEFLIPIRCAMSFGVNGAGVVQAIYDQVDHRDDPAMARRTPPVPPARVQPPARVELKSPASVPVTRPTEEGRARPKTG